MPSLRLAEVEEARSGGAPRPGSSFATAASRCSRSGVGWRSCRRSQRRRLTVSWSTGFGIGEELSSLAQRGHAARDRQPTRRAANAAGAAAGRASSRRAARRGPAVRLVAQRAALDVRRADRAGSGSSGSPLPSTSPRTSSTRVSSSAILVSGKGRSSSTRGRAAQSMLLAAWAEGLASCPNGIRDADAGARRARRDRGRDAGDRAHVRPSRAPRDPERHTVAEWSARANRKPIDDVVRRVT